MVQIRIHTERVREAGRQFRAKSEQLNDIDNALQSAIGSLDTWAWDGRSRADAEPMLDQVRPESDRIAQELDHLGQLLERVVERFENEDSTAARDMEEMPWVEFDEKHNVEKIPVPIRPKTQSDKKIYELRDEIRDAAYGAATPELIAAILQDEIDRRDFKDDLQDIEAEFIRLYEGHLETIERKLLAETFEPIETMSLGIAQMNPETVYGLVENGYISKPPDWDSDKLDITLSWLKDEKGAPKLVAAYLNQMSDTWSKAGYPVDAQMLATLYSHGNGLKPHADPGMNDRGYGIVDNWDHVAGIMQYEEGAL